MTSPDPSLLRGVVAPEVLEALRLASDALTRSGIRHAIVGGLAVGAHGFPRATRDVVFLVGDEAFEHHAGGLVTFRSGVPFQVNRVAVALLSAEPDEPFLSAALDAPPGSVIDVRSLVYLKLKSPRHKDRTEVIELVKAGMDVRPVRAYLAANAAQLVADFDTAVAQARAEE